LGSRAFSHESVFIPEDSEKTYPGQTMSQENVSDKVRDIQLYYTGQLYTLPLKLDPSVVTSCTKTDGK
uniref:Uncharacterized protein n=1 Tax=Sinocyclocheilus anshuiensis TaxID=1608454 RepID=A0A671PU94_9TELE